MTAEPDDTAAVLHVATDDPTPAYEQLRRQLADLVATGILRPGDRLPPLRQLAADLGLAVGTVARTYRELEAAGLVASRRGGGTRVTDRSGDRTTDRSGQSLRSSLEARAASFARQIRLLGVTDEDALGAVRDALATLPDPARLRGRGD